MSWTQYEPWVYALAKSCDFHEYLEFALLAQALVYEAQDREATTVHRSGPGIPTTHACWVERGRE